MLALGASAGSACGDASSAVTRKQQQNPAALEAAPGKKAFRMIDGRQPLRNLKRQSERAVVSGRMRCTAPVASSVNHLTI